VTTPRHTINHYTHPDNLTNLVHDLDTINLNDTHHAACTKGLCNNANNDNWYPKQGIHGPSAICRACPVQHQCLLTALTLNDRWGIWGGLTADHRRQLNHWIKQHRKINP